MRVHVDDVDVFDAMSQNHNSQYAMTGLHVHDCQGIIERHINTRTAMVKPD